MCYKQQGIHKAGDSVTTADQLEEHNVPCPRLKIPNIPGRLKAWTTQVRNECPVRQRTFPPVDGCAHPDSEGGECHLIGCPRIEEVKT